MEGLISLYLSIRGLRKGPGKFLVGVLEKSWILLSVKEWEPCIVSQKNATNKRSNRYLFSEFCYCKEVFAGPVVDLVTRHTAPPP